MKSAEAKPPEKSKSKSWRKISVRRSIDKGWDNPEYNIYEACCVLPAAIGIIPGFTNYNTCAYFPMNRADVNETLLTDESERDKYFSKSWEIKLILPAPASFGKTT